MLTNKQIIIEQNCCKLLEIIFLNVKNKMQKVLEWMLLRC